jgi:hypothetical protein
MEDVVLPIALVLPFSDISIMQRKDKELNFHWLQARPQAESMFISIQSICCGAFLVPECTKDGEFLVVDIVDTDMFLRIRSMYPT